MMANESKWDRERRKQRGGCDKRLFLLILFPILLLIVFVEFAYLTTMDTNVQENKTISAKLRNEFNENVVMDSISPETTETPAPIPTDKMYVKKDRIIMVLIANYRDSKRCSETLKSIFENAVYPDLVRVSVYDQLYVEEQNEKPCVDSYCELVGEVNCRRFQTQSRQIHADKAIGPVAGRYVTEQAVTNEDFCLAIDSHLVFVPEWDEKVLQQYVMTDNPKAIITIYPKATDVRGTEREQTHIQLMCKAKIAHQDPDAMIMYSSIQWLKKTDMPKPRLMSQFAGGFNFGTCQSIKDVPNDPYTPYLFQGEEFSRAARLFTWGYDMYAPSEDIAYHWYEKRKYVWDEDWGKKYLIQQKSKRRIRYQLGLPVTADDFDHMELERFGLGTKRTMAQFIEFTRIDPLAPHTGDDNQFDNCRELTLVPYNK